MKKEDEFEYYDEIKDWNFDSFQIETEDFTNWHFYDLIRSVVKKNLKYLI